jgi:hypothetical protein
MPPPWSMHFSYEPRHVYGDRHRRIMLINAMTDRSKVLILYALAGIAFATFISGMLFVAVTYR